MEQQQLNTIFNYMTLTPYLKDFIATKKDNAAYSFRSMSNKLKKISHSHLYQVFSGKRKLPIEIADEFSTKILKLDPIESRYFKALVEVDHHLDTIDENLDVKELEKKLRLLKPRQMKIVEANEVLIRPITLILFEFVQRKKFKNIKHINPQVFYMEIEESQIRESLQLLVDLKMITVDSEGYIHRISDSINTKNDIPSQYVRNYHKQMAGYASNVIEKVEPEHREFQNLILNINKYDLKKSKQLIRSFLDDFTRQMSQESNVEDRDATYTLNINFFPIVKE
jgi:uncharacterized protein (TIGR02147 family)